jgi:hypothetical protein
MKAPSQTPCLGSADAREAADGVALGKGSLQRGDAKAETARFSLERARDALW